ncbi:MAG: hypothetical protein AAF682_05870 [Planctomycetota bacterium]
MRPGPGVRRRTSRRGALLLQASFLILVLMGLLALVVDLGIARATQNYMQASADVAAAEGLRFRDADPLNPLQSDLDRRIAASRAASLVFDEDADLTTGPAAYLLGAGPQIDTGVAGIADPAGGLLIDQGPYLPALELNSAANVVHGDLVAGRYIATDPLGANPDWHAENSAYLRNDFVPAPVGAAPGAPAFLARLRRTNDLGNLDNQPGVSSSGPTLPYLFGLGSGVLTSEDPDTYDPRRDGITIRATSIADARPALAVGVMGALVNGLARVGDEAADPAIARVLALDDASWQADFVTDGPFQLGVYADGSVLGLAGGPTPLASGFAQPAAGPVRVGDTALNTPVVGSVALPVAAPAIEGVRFVALYTTTLATLPRVTGFAAVEIDAAVPSTDGSGNAILFVSGRKLASIVAPENASAVPALATDVNSLLPQSTTRQLLLAPVLAR